MSYQADMLCNEFEKYTYQIIAKSPREDQAIFLSSMENIMQKRFKCLGICEIRHLNV